MFKSTLNIIYFCLFLVSLALLFCSCATCPGAKNLAYPQFYKAQDLMKYELSEKCMISKTDSAKFNGQEWVGTINQTDDIIFTFKEVVVDDTSSLLPGTYEYHYLNYFHLTHHGTYEELYQLLGKYLSFFDTYGMEYKYSSGFNFKCNYLNWSVEGYWRSEDLSIVCTRKG